MSNASHHFGQRTQNLIIAGIATVVPIWITWLVFEFVGKQLLRLGRPWVTRLSDQLAEPAPQIASLLLHDWFTAALALLVTLAGLYALGWIATMVVGKRILGLVDEIIARIPLVQTVYGATRKLVGALQQKPEGTQRVVLIEFPSPHMKTIGLVTRVLEDADSGASLAAVYVPTTPNPTSGYVEIVPVEKLVPLDWTLDEAMTFIVSGGAVAPDRISYHVPPDVEAQLRAPRSGAGARGPVAKS